MVRQRPLFRGVAARPGYVLGDVFWVASVVRQRPLFRGVAARPGYVLGDVFCVASVERQRPLFRGVAVRPGYVISGVFGSPAWCGSVPSLEGWPPGRGMY